jgi:hypothetical protein
VSCADRICTWPSHRHRVTAIRGCIDTICLSDDEHDVLKTCRELKIKNKCVEKNCASRWSFTKNHYMMHSQQNVKYKNSVTVSYNHLKLKASSIILEHFHTEYLTCKVHIVLFNAIFWMTLMSTTQVWHPGCSPPATPHLGRIWSTMRQRVWTAPACLNALTSLTSLTRRLQSQCQNSPIQNLFCEYFYTTITKTPHFKTPICHIWTI